MRMNDSRFANIDLEDLISRLTAVALSWFAREGLKGEESILPGTGKSAKDLVFDTLLAVLRDEDVRWQPQTPEENPFPLLVIVMRHDFLDLIKKGRAYKRTTIVDSITEEENRGRFEQTSDFNEDFSSAEARVLAKRLYPLIEDERKLKDYIDAILLQGLVKRKEIAEHLGITSQEARNRERRLQTRLARWYSSLSEQRVKLKTN